MSAPAVIVIAKSPQPGRSKTRLCPPCTPAQAACLAEAALRDTLDAAVATRPGRTLVALDGEPGDWLPAGAAVFAQRGEGLAERLAAAFEDVGGPALVVAMDTPQLTPALLELALAKLQAPGVDAVLGPSRDGGYWGIGLHRPGRSAFDGVPMSTPHTGAAQAARLRALGLATADLPVLTDVDTIESAREVARAGPGTRFAAALERSGHAGDDGQPVAQPAA